MHVLRLAPICAVAVGLALVAACSSTGLTIDEVDSSVPPAAPLPTSTTFPQPTGAPTPPPPVPTPADAGPSRFDASDDATMDAGIEDAEAGSTDAAPDALDAATEAAPPCSRTSADFPACRGADRRVFSVTCTQALKACNGTVTTTTSTADLTIDLYPTILATTVDYPGLPAVTGTVMASPTYRFIIGQGTAAVRVTGSLGGLIVAASAPGAGYNELHQYSVDRATMQFSSTSHYQSRGPCGGGGPQMTDFNCSGGLKP